MSKNFDGIFQDWEPVILRNKNAQTKLKAKREGNTETKAKNPMSETQIRAAKLERDNESTRVETVSNELKTLIIKGRNAKNLTQKQLANMVQMKPSDIQLYENGKAIPKHQDIMKLQRALGVKLTGLKKK
jgi:ribosome-binding protein aMBF1 (putative translation factor)